MLWLVRVDFTVLLGAACLAGQWAWALSTAAPVLFAVVLAMVALHRNAGLGWRQMTAAAFVILVGAWRAHADVTGFESTRESARRQIPHAERCEGRARVASSPMLLHVVSAPGVHVADPPAPALTWTGEAQLVVCGGHRVTGATTVRLSGGYSDLARGDVVDFVADLGLVELLQNEGLDDPRPRAARRRTVLSGRALIVDPVAVGRGVASWIDRQRARVRARIEATFAQNAAPLARALVLGETDLDPEDDAAFRTSGLAHLLAVSGTHLVLAVATMVRAIRALLVRIEPLAARYDAGRIASIFGVALAWAYADFAGGSGSARRAAAMLSAAYLARLLGRLPAASRSFGLSLLGGTAADPLAAFDASFVLSVAATGGMLLLHKRLSSALALWKIESPIAETAASAAATEPRLRVVLTGWVMGRARLFTDGLATTLAATVACTPYLALLAPSLPVGGLFANALAAPIGEIVALPICLAHGLLAPWPNVERGAAAVASGSLLLVRAVAHATTELTWLAVRVPSPTSWQLALLASSAIWLWRSPNRGRVSIALVTAATWAVFEVGAVRAGAPRDRLRITFLDVGQGDSALVDLPSGGAMLVDGGGSLGGGLDPGRAVVAPLLRSRRRSHVDLVVLSHPHPDHMGGLASALAGVSVGEFWDNGQGEIDAAGPVYDSLVAGMRRRNIRVRYPSDLCGSHTVGGATVDVLAPCPSLKPLADPNDNSFVLRIGFGRRAALLVGDAPTATEADVLASHRQAVQANLLKVGHHGSQTSSSAAWLDAIDPRHAVISVGVRNRFGHPSPLTLSRLEAVAPITVWRTDRNGAVRWETDGQDVWVSATNSTNSTASAKSSTSIPSRAR